MADDEDDYLWPVAGLNILAGGNAHSYHAFLQWQHSPDMREYGYISGFRMAAELMFKHVEETGSNSDQLVFPFGLCWRHHMELQLKSLLMELQRYQFTAVAPFALSSSAAGEHDDGHVRVGAGGIP